MSARCAGTLADVPATAPLGVPVGPRMSGRSQQLAVRVIQVGLVAVVLLQRLAFPVGDLGISLTLGVGYAALGALLICGAVICDVRRTMLYVLGGGACGLAASANTLGGTPIAYTSFLLLLVVYLPWVFRLRDDLDHRSAAYDVARFFARLMSLAGLVAVAQFAAQRLGVWTFNDVVADVVPPGWLLGDYNNVIPIEYASPIMKSQAFVFLEPSFLCQFLALGILLSLLVRAPLWQPVVMGLGMLSTYSGTGLVLLGVGVVLLLVRSPRSVRPSVVICVVAVVGVLLTTSAAEPMLKRTNETSDPTSSWSLRFVLPYQEVARGLSDSPERYIIGAGPGSAERVLENARQGVGLAVVYPVAPKLLFEYGVPAGAMFLWFWLACLLRRKSLPVVAGSLAVMLGVLSGSLLQPHTLILAWLLSLVVARE